MPNKTFTPEQIVGMLRQLEVLVSQGKTVPLARISHEQSLIEQAGRTGDQ